MLRTDADVDALLRNFKFLVDKWINNFVSVAKTKKNCSNPWITKEFLQLMRKTKREFSTKFKAASAHNALVEGLKSILKEKMLAPKAKNFSLALSEYMK